MMCFFKVIFMTACVAGAFCSCGDKPHEQNALAAISAAEKAKESWLDDRKAIEILLATDKGDTIASLPSIGVHARMREATASESAALCGVEFTPNRANIFVSPDANALCSDTAVEISVCHPFRKGIKTETAIEMKAPFRDNLYGVEIKRETTSKNIRVKMQMRSAMAVLRIVVKADDAPDSLDAIALSGKHIYTKALLMPYLGRWHERQAEGRIIQRAEGKDTLDIYLIPTDEAQEATLVAFFGKSKSIVKLNLPPMRADSVYTQIVQFEQ